MPSSLSVTNGIKSQNFIDAGSPFLSTIDLLMSIKIRSREMG